MYKITRVEDYIRLVEQTRDELEDLIACAEDEGEGESEFIPLMPKLRAVEHGLQTIQTEIKAGTHVIARDEPLPFMNVVNELRRQLPVAIVSMLDALNTSHKSGFAES